MRLLILLLLAGSIYGWEHSEWLEQAKGNIDESAIEWLRSKLNQEIGTSNVQPSSKQCETCFNGEIFDTPKPKLYVFMSFSIPESTWLSLSKEMEGKSGVFVLRGLPGNSFKEFTRKISQLKEIGVSTPIHLDPLLFKKYRIEEVPTFLFLEKDEKNRISGHISLNYTLLVLEREKNKLK